MKMYYTDYRDYLDDNLPGFKTLGKTMKLAICILISNPRPHYTDTSSYVMTKSYIRNHVWRDAKEILGIMEYMNLITIDNEFYKGIARKIAFTDYCRDLMKGAEQVKLMQRLSHERKAKLRDSPAEIVDTLIVDGVVIDGAPTINIDKVKEYAAGNYKHTDMALQVLNQTTEDNRFPQVFYLDAEGYRLESKNTHRITGNGLTVQNMSRKLRAAMFHGYYDYDIHNCHFAILANHGHTFCQYYTENKDEVRETIANDIGVTTDAVKWCLLALLYGATDSTYYKTALGKHMGDKGHEFYNHFLVQQLVKESYLADPIELMQIEQQIMRVITQNLVVTVPMHDGFMYPLSLDTEYMQERVKEYTGYSITITRKEVNYDNIQEK